MTLDARGIHLNGRLADVSCTLNLGEITAVCGPNGAGKSTLLQVLAGLIAPDEGAISLGGTAMGDIKQPARRIGYLPQNPEIAWDVTARSVIELGRIPHGDAATGPVEAAIDTLDLRLLEHRRAQSLSGGEQARVLLARVLAGEPEWILADEPLSALDLAHQIALMRHLRIAADGGKGVVVVLHDLAMAMNHADRVLVLDDGYLVQDGSARDALSEKNILRTWGVETCWLGEKGARALIAT